MLALQWPNDHVIYYPPRKANAVQCLKRYFVQYIGVEYIPQVAANVQLAKILAQAQGNVNRQWIDVFSTRANSHSIKERPKSVHASWRTVGSRGNTQPQQSTNILLLRRRFSRLLSPLFFPCHHHKTQLKDHAAKTKERANPRGGKSHHEIGDLLI